VESGYIRLYRSIQEHWLWEKQPFSQGQAWIDLLMRAGYKDKTVAFDKQVISLNRGQFVTSERSLMEKWGWNKTRVRIFLKLLESEKMITRKSDHLKTIITICNYAAFQDFGKYDTDQRETSNEPVINQLETSDEPLENQQETSDEPVINQLETSDEPLENQQETSDEPVRDQTNKRKKENKGKKENNIPPLSPQGEDAFSDYAQGDGELLETLRAFEEMRNRIKSPMTPKAKVLLVKKLEKEAGHVRNKRKYKLECLNQSILQNWKTIYPVKEFADEGEEPALTPEEQALQEQLARMRR